MSNMHCYKQFSTNALVCSVLLLSSFLNLLCSCFDPIPFWLLKTFCLIITTTLILNHPCILNLIFPNLDLPLYRQIYSGQFAHNLGGEKEPRFESALLILFARSFIFFVTSDKWFKLFFITVLCLFIISLPGLVSALKAEIAYHRSLVHTFFWIPQLSAGSSQHALNNWNVWRTSWQAVPRVQLLWSIPSFEPKILQIWVGPGIH